MKAEYASLECSYIARLFWNASTIRLPLCQVLFVIKCLIVLIVTSRLAIAVRSAT